MLKKWIFTTLSLVICHAAFAATTAIDFAQQAGSIAGAAAACGQNISVFMQRTQEALNIMAVNNLDKATAMQAFQQNLLNMQMRQAQKSTFPCSQVLQDYAALPLLQDDYKTSVFPKLAPTATTIPAASNTLPSSTTDAIAVPPTTNTDPNANKNVLPNNNVPPDSSVTNVNTPPSINTTAVTIPPTT